MGRRLSPAIDRNAPPTGTANAIGCAAVAPIAAVPILMVIGVPLWLSVALPIAAGAGLGGWLYSKTRAIAHLEDDAYSRQWYCAKCGSIFVEPQTQREPVSGALSSVQLQPRSADLQAYVDRVIAPIQRAKSPTDRDWLGLAQIIERASADGSFDPVGLDKGLVSRLASLDFITFDLVRDQFLVTAKGRNDGVSKA